MYQWREDFCPDTEKCVGKAPAEDGADEAGTAAGCQNVQTAERTGGIPRKTKYGKADETELSDYQYRSDGREHQIL